MRLVKLARMTFIINTDPFILTVILSRPVFVRKSFRTRYYHTKFSSYSTKCGKSLIAGPPNMIVESKINLFVRNDKRYDPSNEY